MPVIADKTDARAAANVNIDFAGVSLRTFYISVRWITALALFDAGYRPEGDEMPSSIPDECP